MNPRAKPAHCPHNDGAVLTLKKVALVPISFSHLFVDI
jgi:hypothetical protein